jgi:hypothetical protein
MPGSGEVKYTFSGESCSCNSAGDCASCAAKVAQYCSGGSGGGGAGGFGGGGGGFGGGGGGGFDGGGGGCAMGGYSCQSFRDCCSGTCANQVCIAPQCISDGNSCTLASECCSHSCAQGTCTALTTPPPACSTKPRLTCISCCSQTHPAGSARAIQLLQACACTNPTCKTACAATLCKTPSAPADQGCQSCLVAQCSTQTLSSCEADPTCAPYAQCLLSCPAM